MATAAQHDVVPLDRADEQAIRLLDQTAFVSGNEYLQVDLGFFEWDRVFGVRTDTGRLVGLDTAYSFGLSVPDGAGGGGVRQVPVGALSWVSVDPGHRRRGILRALITHHLRAVRERGEVASALHASEAAIYQRFGYGLATTGLRLTIGRGAELHPVEGSDDVEVTFDALDAGRDAERMNALYLQAAAATPGMVRRGLPHLVSDLFDPTAARGQEEPMRVLFARRAGRDTGYAVIRRSRKWEAGGPAGEVGVEEATTLDAATAHALWTRLVDLDLMATTRTWSMGPDDPLLHLLVDARAARATRADDLWLRVVDVPAALAARTYAHDVDAVLEVADALLPENAGRWRLRGGPDGATCEPTSDAADMALDVKQLGAVYPGGTTLAGLHRAGLVTERTPGAVVRLSTAFRSATEPWSGWVF